MNKQSVRRKLLAGSLSAPLVLTVSSVGAATTSFDRAYRPRTDATGAAAVVPATNNMWNADSWYRVLLTATRYDKNNCNPQNLPYLYVQYPTAYGGDNLFYEMTASSCVGGTYTLTGRTFASLSSSPAPGGYNNVSSVQVAVLAYFSSHDPTGTPSKLALSSNSASYVANKSVYASVIP